MSRRIVVTGARGVLGRAVMAHLSRAGDTAIGIDVAPDAKGDAAVLGGIDLTDPASATAAFDRIRADGAIHGLANIAGGFQWETVADGDPATWDRMYRLNVATTVNASRAALNGFAGGGAIVNVGAAATLKAGAGMGAYTASKSAVARFTEAFADELKDRDIRVNAVLPSILDTPANRSDMGSADAAKWVRPDDLAAVIAFLLSDAAYAVTGACIPVTGRV